MPKLLIAATLLTAFAIGSAQATISPNGSFSGAYGHTTATSGGTFLIGTGTTSVKVVSPGIVINLADPYVGSINNLAALHGGTVIANLFTGSSISMSQSSFNIANGAITPFTVTLGSYTFTFNSEVVTSKVDRNLGLLFSGNLTNDSTGRLTAPAAADYSLTFTESSPTGAIGTAFSIDTPPISVLEPASIALLGVGLLGLGLVRRRA